jgi:hypothetical protein
VSRFSFLGTCLYPPHLRRTGSIALVVGTWLTLFNQGDVVWDGHVGGWIWIKIVLNYLTPSWWPISAFCRSGGSKVARRSSENQREERRESLLQSKQPVDWGIIADQKAG